MSLFATCPTKVTPKLSEKGAVKRKYANSPVCAFTEFKAEFSSCWWVTTNYEDYVMSQIVAKICIW